MYTEQILIDVRSSQWANFKAYAIGGFVLIFCLALGNTFGAALALFTICWMAWKWLEVSNRRFIVTNQRIVRQQGIFVRETNDIELVRVHDVRLYEPYFLRLFGLGHVVVTSMQYGSHHLLFEAVPNAYHLRESIRGIAENGGNWIYTAPAQQSDILASRGEGQHQLLSGKPHDNYGNYLQSGPY